MFEAAESTGTKLAIHLEPYANRSWKTVLKDVAELLSRYGNSTALAKRNNLPLFYLYDSYHLPQADWRKFFEEVRGGDLDGFFIGLYLNDVTADHLEQFDGFYTYFAHLGREDNYVNRPRD